MEYEALLHDKKINSKVNNESNTIDLSDKQKTALETAQKEAQTRIARRHGR